MKEMSGLNVRALLNTTVYVRVGQPLKLLQSSKCLFLQQLENSLNDFGEKWVLNPGDGAFYGPKVSHALR